MKRSGILCSVLLSISVLLGGCGYDNPFDHMPDLTEEESALISEYAAGILLKHDRNMGKLASENEITAADEREAIRRANMEAYMASKVTEGEEEAGEESENSEGGNATSEAAAEEIPFPGIAQFCGIEGFQIDYIGHMISDSYPEADSSEMFFAMDATPGSKLLVLQFAVENLTTEDRELNLFEQDVRFRISVNDGSRENALSTLLLDDLASFQGVVPAGSNVVLVLTREVPEEEADSVQTISLTIRNESGSATTLLE